VWLNGFQLGHFCQLFLLNPRSTRTKAVLGVRVVGVRRTRLGIWGETDAAAIALANVANSLKNNNA